MKFSFLPLVILSTIFLSDCGNEKTIPQHVVFKWNVDSSKYDFAKYVDPMIGTAGHGHTFPGATAPFGMVQLSPDTRVDGSWDGCSGYHYSDSVIYGFSHTHLSGTGCSDYGDILFMPSPDLINFEDYTLEYQSKHEYCETFSHKNEKAEAGYYSVVLDNSKTKVELTTSPRVGVHRYTFENDKENWIRLDLVHRDEVIDSKVEIINDHTIQGYRFSKAWASDQRVYFYAEFSKNFSEWAYPPINGDGQTIHPKEMSGKNVKIAFSFANGKSEPIILKVALSAVSCENAKLNMQTEVPDFDFDAVHKKVVQQWNDELGKIEVKSGDETKKKIFYTALYHCFIAPNLYCDVNGDYRGRDNKIHCDTIHPQYTVFSLWDTYRALHPLFTIIQQKRDQDFISTFVKQAQEGGLLPVWELSANETNCMIGYHSVPVIVDAWMKGLTNFDTATAYEAMVHSAMQGTNGLDAYKKCGFIPAEGESESVSKTLEYAYDDWCIALAAKRMKRDEDYKLFMRRSQSWKNLYEPETGFFRPRLNNSFVQPFDPNEVNFHYTEANAWQYSLAVQQDIPGLIEAHGGDKKFIAFLDKLFSTSSATSGRDQADISGMIGQYAQGNEPSHHMAYLYDYTSEPWKTDSLVSLICNTLFTDKPDGLCGNEDCGQMSAWFVMSCLGMYQTSPGTNDLVLSVPQMNAVLHLENGKTDSLMKVMLPSDKGVLKTAELKYVEINGKMRFDKTISYSDLMKGSSLKWCYSNDAPQHGYWTDYFNHAHSEEPCVDFMKPEDLSVPEVPLVKFAHDVSVPNSYPEAMRTFSGAMIISMQYNQGNKYFTSINNGPFEERTVLFDINETSTIKAFAKNTAGICSDTISFSYTKIPAGRAIHLNSQYANQYAAGGNNALIDGIRGGDNFRTGDWQGYEGKDMDAVIDLGSVKDISHIATGFLQDQNAWIFFPSEVIFYSSMDGKTFTEIEANKNTFKQDSQTVLLHDFYTDKKVKARYIKVLAKNSGPCPSWHPGKGNPSWIFADEIVIK